MKHSHLLANKYFKNLEQIELEWGKLRKNGFPFRERDNFWKLCSNGRMMFFAWIQEEYKNNANFYAPPSVPAFQRAVMLLEVEKKYSNIIILCKLALQYINNEWYQKKIKKYSKFIK